MADKRPKKMKSRKLDRPDLELSGDIRPGNVHSEKWWEMDAGPRQAQEIFSLKSLMVQNQMNRQRDLSNWSMMYRGVDISRFINAVGVPTSTPGSATPSQRGAGPILNVTKSVCDAVMARISSDKPKPYLLSSGGNWKLQRQVKQQQKVADGLLYEWDYYRNAPRVGLDACIWGGGAFKIFEDDRRIKIERTKTPEIFVDVGESTYGDPRQMLQRKYMPRDTLVAMYPEAAEEIKAAELQSAADGQQTKSVCDLVETCEAWKLPPVKGAKGGKHVIAIDRAVLFVEDWDEDEFPFEFLRYDWAQDGFWGVGVCEAGESLQQEINSTMMRISQCLKRCATTRAWIPRGAKVVKSQISNLVGQMIEYTGPQPPTIDASNVVPPQLFEQLEKLMSQYYSLAGVSQQDAANEKSPGVNSGRAQRVEDDIRGARRQVFADEYQQLAVRVVEKALRLARKIHDRDGKFSVNVAGRKFLDKVDYIPLEDDVYTVTIRPSNLLPDTPAGKLETITEGMQNGLWNQDVAMDLLDYPDLEAALGPRNAPVELIKFHLEKMLDEGEQMHFEAAYQDPQLAKMLVGQTIQYAEMNACPEANLAMARAYLTEVLNAIPPPPAPAPPGPGPGMPPPGPAPLGVPGHPPVGDLLKLSAHR